MTIVHALIIGGNLLLATLLYVVSASSRRADALRIGLIVAFAVVALLDLATAGSSEVITWVVLAFDLVLVVLVARFVRDERRDREEVAAARDAELAARQRAELELSQERADRQLALRDRLGTEF